ncbi:MAG: hypothetical protein RL573_1342, partial [Actinomycetota bacterium]
MMMTQPTMTMGKTTAITHHRMIARIHPRQPPPNHDG